MVLWFCDFGLLLCGLFVTACFSGLVDVSYFGCAPHPFAFVFWVGSCYIALGLFCGLVSLLWIIGFPGFPGFCGFNCAP